MKSSTVLVNTNQPDLYPESVIALEQALHIIRQKACNGWLKKYSVCDRFDLLPTTASVR